MKRSIDNEPRGEKLINQYKKNYCIPKEIEITEDMILFHWELEKKLAERILNSPKERHIETAKKCYDELYEKIFWLNKFSGKDDKTPSEIKYKIFIKLTGLSKKRILEIGSGKGELISFLSSYGHICKGTEITNERRIDNEVLENKNIQWDMTDGINLGRFELKNYYDIVISNQVIEHLHPDDLVEHFKGVNEILASDGLYIFTTPHRFLGPFDISRVFNKQRTYGMHLKEYCYRELKDMMILSGFKEIYGVFILPRQVNRYFNRYFPGLSVIQSKIYLYYLCIIEIILSLIPSYMSKKICARVTKIIGFYGISLVGRK